MTRSYIRQQMTTGKSRYSHLAPLDTALQLELTLKALEFFSPLKWKENAAVIGKEVPTDRIQPFFGFEFIQFLDKSGILKEPFRYLNGIRDLLDRLERTGILTVVGMSQSPTLPKFYYFSKEFTTREQTGLLWLAPALGEAFLHSMVSQGVVQITGKSGVGDVECGSGIILDAHHVLTCAHVLTDMKLDDTQNFQRRRQTVSGSWAHSSCDVGILRVREPLDPVLGQSFQHPRIAQSIMSLGYPKIIGTRDAALLVHRGEVTNANVTSLDGKSLFLYSAISRPGNSGGPVISSDGHVLGITSRDLVAGDAKVSPYYAAVPTREIAQAVADLNVGVQIQIEDYQ